jgi:hypothetical protein
MKPISETIRKIVGYLNNPEHGGGIWLPNIQRNFVWNEEQMTRLFDSILREYPFSTLLIWKTTSDTPRRRFIDHYCRARDHGDFVPADTNPKLLVLDGQQRLQTLFIGLKGSLEGRELFFDVLSGSGSTSDDIRFKFEFFAPKDAPVGWVKFKDLVFSEEKRSEARDRLAANFAKAGRALTVEETRQLEDNIDRVFDSFRDRERVFYQLLDSVDRPNLYQEEDVVEIFIRANAGGTKLGKSELLYALLKASWDDARPKLDELLEKLNRSGFAYSQDFVLKTCLTLLDKGARYEVEKFRDIGTREAIETRWEEIAAAIAEVSDYLKGNTFIRSDKGLPSYLALIPHIYARFHFPEQWRTAPQRDFHIIRTSLCGSFGGSPDGLIDASVKVIRADQGFDCTKQFGVIRDHNRALEITTDRFLSLGYGSYGIHLLLNWWYRSFNYDPVFSGGMPQVDHIFPDSKLRAIKMMSSETGRMSLQKYRQPVRNQLANCMLLTRDENGSGQKTDQTPEQWFANKSDDYLDKHIIPRDRSLLHMDRFEDFVKARQTLLLEKFKPLLVQNTLSP